VSLYLVRHARAQLIADRLSDEDFARPVAVQRVTNVNISTGAPGTTVVLRDQAGKR